MHILLTMEILRKSSVPLATYRIGFLERMILFSYLVVSYVLISSVLTHRVLKKDRASNFSHDVYGHKA